MKIKYLIGALACTSAFASITFTGSSNSQEYNIDIAHTQEETAEAIEICHYEFDASFGASGITNGLVDEKRIGMKIVGDMHVGSTTALDVTVDDGHAPTIDMVKADDTIGNPFLSRITLSNFVDSGGSSADSPLKNYLLLATDSSQAHDQDDMTDGLWLRNSTADTTSDGTSVFFAQGLINVTHVGLESGSAATKGLFDNDALDIMENGDAVAAGSDVANGDYNIGSLLTSCSGGPGVASELTDYIKIEYDTNTLDAIDTMVTREINTDTFAGAYADWAFYSDKYNQTASTQQNILIESDVVLTIAEDL